MNRVRVEQNASLKPYNTLQLGARAGLLCVIETEEDLLDAPLLDPRSDFILGGGSNVVLVTDVPGTVFLNRITGKAIIDEHDDTAFIEVGAGEDWHALVEWTLDQGLTGLENLSLIPGLAGAAPVQNIGAYGVELSSVLDCVTAWDMLQARWITFTPEQCQLSYRDSLFKSAGSERYLITSIRLRLDRRFKPVLEYQGLRQELDQMGVSVPTPRQVSEGVIRLRTRKLPDPASTPNVGSFFKNPVLSATEADELKSAFPELPSWPVSADKTKVSAAWVIEQSGFRGFRDGDAGVSDRHALVLVNHGSARGSDIARLAETIRESVNHRFGIWLEPEPKLVSFESGL